MLLDWVSNPGPLAHESDASLGPAVNFFVYSLGFYGLKRIFAEAQLQA